MNSENMLRNLIVLSRGRIVVILLLGAALGLQYWTWFHRYPVIAKKQVEMQRIHDLDGEFLQMMLRWNQQEATEVESNLKVATKKLFSGDADSATWSEQINQPSAALALDINVRSEEPVPHPQHKDSLSILPTNWTVKPAAADKEDIPMLADLLSFLKDMTTDQPKRMDLVNLTVRGDGSTLTNARVGFRLWFHKEEGEAP